MSTNTVLYLGFSFTDAYLNELRSEILSLLGHSGGGPIAYAVSNDVPETSRLHYSKHEGIEFLSYDTNGGADYSGFDRILEAIHNRTNPAMRYRALLQGKRLLWVDPRYEANFRWAHDYFDMRAGREVLDLARSAPEALDRLAKPQTAGRNYDLVVCFWGDETASQIGSGEEPLGLALMRGIRERGVGVPVVFFAEKHIFQQRKRQVLEMGALGCYYRWESLLSAIQHAVDPESETK
jgi:pimeloyl-ACP methyl ester carboxylesterase